MNSFVKLLVPLAVLALPMQARADVAGSAAAALSAETVAARNTALAELDAAKASDPLAAYAAGSVQFFVALEKLASGLHRHGFESPQSYMLPLMRLPVPANPNPEPLTYEGFRQILSDFREAMAQSAATLALVPAGADIGVEVDLRKIGIDLDEDGKIAPQWESAAAIMAALSNNSGDAPDASRAGVPLRPRRRLLAAGLCQFPDGAGGFLAGARLPAGLRPELPDAVPEGRAADAGRAGAARRRQRQHVRQRMAHRRFRLVRPSGQLAGRRAGAAQGGAQRTAGDDPAQPRGLEGDPRRDRQ